MNDKTQYPFATASNFMDYIEGRIKMHETTRTEKEEDRMMQVKIRNADIEPILFAYPAVKEINRIVENIVKSQPAEYDFTSSDDVRPQMWVINDKTVDYRIPGTRRSRRRAETTPLIPPPNTRSVSTLNAPLVQIVILVEVRRRKLLFAAEGESQIGDR